MDQPEKLIDSMLEEAEDGRPGEQKQQVQANKANKNRQDNRGMAAEKTGKRTESMQQQREDTGAQARKQQEVHESSADDNVDTQTPEEGSNPAAHSEGDGDSTKTAEDRHAHSRRSAGSRKDR